MKYLLFFLLLTICSPAFAFPGTTGFYFDPRNYGATCAGQWYSITGSSLSAAGSGYAPGDTFIIEDNNLDNHMRGGLNATGHVLTVDGSGAVLTYTIDNAGTGYFAGGIGPVFTTSGSGSGLILTIASVNSTPAKPTVTLASGGAGWAVGDTFYIPNATAGNYMTGRVATISSGAVATFTINNSGGDYSTGNNINAYTFSGTGRGLQVNITSVTNNASNGTWDDTYGIVRASASAQFLGSVMMPDQCWGQNVMLVNGTSVVGQRESPNYGYSDLAISGKYLNVSAAPHFFIYGTPNFGFDFNNMGGLSFSSFEVRAYASGAFGTTGCLGSFSGGGGFNYLGTIIPTIRLYKMSAKACYAGLGNPGGSGSFLYVNSYFSDYGGNNNGIWGPFSDFVSIEDTAASDTTGIWLSSTAGGLARIIAPRLEYNVTHIELDAGGVQTQIDQPQFDRSNKCAVLINSAAGVTITGGIIKGAGLYGTLTVTNAIDNGSGLIRLTVTAKDVNGSSIGTGGLSTGDVVNITSVSGTTEANGTWTLTKIDSSHIDLQGSAFVNAYVSGGLGGVNGKAAAICLSSATDFHTTGVAFSGYSAGANLSSAYILDSVSSNKISMIGGVAQSGNTGFMGSYRGSFANWRGGIPANVELDVAGNAPCRNDTTVFSIDCTSGSIGIGTNAPASTLGLDMTSTTKPIGLPTWTNGTRPGSPSNGMLGYNSSTPGVEAYYSGQFNPLGSVPLTNYLGGLTLSNDNSTPNTVIDVAAGTATDDTNAISMLLPSAFTKTTGSWAVGSGNGCLDTGSVANSTWYHLFVIERTDSSLVDVLCSTSATTPTMPASYTVKRRAGSFKTDGSAHIITFTQVGSIFYWGTATLDINISNLGTSAGLQTLNVPTGVKVTPLCRYTMSKDGNVVILTSGDETDVAPSNTNPMSAAPGSDTIDTTIAAGVVNTTCPVLTTNTSSQIRARSSAASTTLSIVTRGWID